MIWIFGIIAFVVIISLIAGLIAAASSSGDQIAAAQASAEWERRMASRVGAYRDFIRRQGNEDWKKMSDNELEDMIADAVRSVARDINRLRSVKSWTYWITLPSSILTFAYVGRTVVGGSPEGQTAITILAISCKTSDLI